MAPIITARSRRGWPRLRAMPLLMALACSSFARADPGEDYVLHCMGCHGARAEGVSGKVPALSKTLVPLMRSAAGRDYLLRVPGAANSTLSDARLAEVLNWVATRFGDGLTDGDPRFTTTEISARRHYPLADVLATRERVVAQLAAQGTSVPVGY